MKQSAGILVYRMNDSKLPEVFLVHPGGPFWKNKDEGAWSIPKGEYAGDEAPLEAAKREFAEETGHKINGNFQELTPLKQKSGKLIRAWAVAGNINPSAIKSNLFELEWPPRSGRRQQFPEVDRGEWFGMDDAKRKIIPGQLGFLAELTGLIFNSDDKK